MEADRLGKYQLVQHLASGGMASVYLARLSGMGGFERHVVLKTLRSQEVDDALVPMFLDEARLVATLHHKHIAQVFEVGRDDGTYFLAMEYVHGETTRHVLETARDRGLALPADFALSVLCAAAAGLHHAHEQRGLDGTPLGIVHRDVTPSNVIVSYDGSIKLIDFGIAKSVARSTVTRSGLIKGKVGYMAPEQVRGYSVDRRSDVFSLGVLAYELTTQTRPFDAATQFEQLERTARGDLIPPSQIVANYPKPLEDVILTALEVEPDDRYPNADTMRRALAQVARYLGLPLGEAPIVRVLANLFGSRPEPWLERRRRARVPTSVETPPLAIEPPAAFARSGSQPPSHAVDDDDDALTDPIELIERADADGSRATTVSAKLAGRTRTPMTRAFTDAHAGSAPLPVSAKAVDSDAVIARGSARRIESLPTAPRTFTPRTIAPSASEPPPVAPRAITSRSIPSPTEPPPVPRTITSRSFPSEPPVPRTITSRSIPSPSEPPPVPRTITPRTSASPSEPPPVPRTITSRSIPSPSEPPPIPRTISPRTRAPSPRTLPPAPRTFTPPSVAPPTAAPSAIAPPAIDPQTIAPPTIASTAADVHGPSSSVATKLLAAPGGSRRLAISGALLFLALAVAAMVVIALDSAPPAPAKVEPPEIEVKPPQPVEAPRPPPPAETPASVPPPMIEPPPTTTVPAPADRVMLHVVTDPPGATVVLDGVRLGTSPFTAEVPIKHGGAWLKVRKKHHLPVKIRVSLEADVTWNVELRARR